MNDVRLNLWLSVTMHPSR